MCHYEKESGSLVFIYLFDNIFNISEIDFT